jgi:hypothetical protein
MQGTANPSSLLSTLLPRTRQRGSKVYQLFLNDITRHCDSGLALLCAASIGKHKVISLNAQERTSLVEYIKRNRGNLDSFAVKALGVDFGLQAKASKILRYLTVRKAYLQYRFAVQPDR